MRVVTAAHALWRIDGRVAGRIDVTDSLDLLVVVVFFDNFGCFDDFAGRRILEEQCVRKPVATLDRVVGDGRINGIAKAAACQIVVDFRGFLRQ